MGKERHIRSQELKTTNLATINTRLTQGGAIFAPPLSRFSAMPSEVTYGSSPIFSTLQAINFIRPDKRKTR